MKASDGWPGPAVEFAVVAVVDAGLLDELLDCVPLELLEHADSRHMNAAATVIPIVVPTRDPTAWSPSESLVLGVPEAFPSTLGGDYMRLLCD